MHKKLILGCGRIGRLRFLAYLNGLFLLASIPLYLASLSLSPDNLQSFIPLILVLVLFNLTSLKFVAQRYHDVNVSGVWSLVFLIPPASPLMYFLLALVPGDRDNNRYGPPAPASSRWLLVLALLPILLLLKYWLSLYTALVMAAPLILAMFTS